ncbi:hypothetical protein C5L30_000775 [Companilactobacillus farciminis]|uniref:ABC-2 type transporter domain-containing protein n=1 Tax=Companilactobacillus farciminis TaxID=1612 RepID=A0A4R5NCY4_9LACO|nr:hypothetical protein [Companilactobacillus farciminis]ATO46800.1 hypothetical protein LF20184_08485 [Companilactobacillus farciminis KCTC 3681 = DSM 20184]KRK61235.1 transport protein [Companilactobacillus farciminis KCTC 3681 = DSM 20184]TDG70998.1 hypothetical protein C5L30_000775 [Companilactobacillus farciminis]
MELRNDWALFKIQLTIAFKERFYFVYTLLVPIFMVFLNKTLDFQDNESIYVYWSYIVVTTVFNGFLLNLVRLRESGFLKTLTYLSGSRHSIILANLLVQLIIVQLEILLFNLYVTFFITHVSLLTFVYGLLTSSLITVLCAAMMSIFFVLKIQRTIFNYLVGGFFTISVLMLGIHPQGFNKAILTIFSPFQFVYGLYVVPCSTVRFAVFLALCSLLYLIISLLVFKKFSIGERLR